jgi:hypothetical protein
MKVHFKKKICPKCKKPMYKKITDEVLCETRKTPNGYEHRQVRYKTEVWWCEDCWTDDYWDSSPVEGGYSEKDEAKKRLQATEWEPN